MQVTPGHGIRTRTEVPPPSAQERLWYALEPILEDKTPDGYVHQRTLIREFKALVLGDRQTWNRLSVDFAGMSPEKSRELVIKIARAAVPEGGSVRDFDRLVADLHNVLDIAHREDRAQTQRERMLGNAEHQLYTVLYDQYDYRVLSAVNRDWPADIFETELRRFLESGDLEEHEFTNMLDWVLPAFAHCRPRIDEAKERSYLLSVFREVKGIAEPVEPPAPDVRTTAKESGVVQANVTTAGILRADVKTVATSQRVTGFDIESMYVNSSKVSLRDDGRHALTSALTVKAEINLEIESILEQSIKALAAGAAIDALKVTVSSDATSAN